MKPHRFTPEPPLPEDVAAALRAHAIDAVDETGLRHALERHLQGYTLVRLTPAAVRRWKSRYRLMFGAGYVDGQSVAEVYARGLLSVLPGGETTAADSQPD